MSNEMNKVWDFWLIAHVGKEFLQWWTLEREQKDMVDSVNHSDVCQTDRNSWWGEWSAVFEHVCKQLPHGTMLAWLHYEQCFTLKRSACLQRAKYAVNLQVNKTTSSSGYKHFFFLLIELPAKKQSSICKIVGALLPGGPERWPLAQTKLSLLKVWPVLVIVLFVRLFLPS